MTIRKTKTSKKAPVKTPTNIANCPPEVWEGLWRVLDAARMAVCPARGQEKEDALMFLADQEKMLRRALGFFMGESGEDYLRIGVEAHPYVSKMKEQDRKLLQEALSVV